MSDDHDQLDPAETLMREVGAQLRQVRLERGEELDEVAQQLRIKATYLFGIEQGDLSTIPGRTYALGFLRSYADYLGFDGDDLMTQIKSTVADLTDKTRLRIRTPLPESRLPKTPFLVLSLAAVAGIYAGWSYVNHGSRLVIETVAEVPGSLRNLALGAFREGGDGEARPAASAAVAGVTPRPAAAVPTAHEARPTMAPPVAPSPDRGAAAPAPEPYPPAARAAAPGPPAAGTSTGVVEPGASPVPANGPEAGPESPTGAVQAYAAPTAPSPPLYGGAPGALDAPAEQAPPAPATADVPRVQAVPVEPAPTPVQQGVPAQMARVEPAPTDLAVSPGAESPAEDQSPGGEPGPTAPDPEAYAGHDQLAALPLDPSTVGRIHEPDNTDARVVLRALESTWIQISSVGGDYLRDRTLERGDVFLVPNRPDLDLWTGNAGGLEVVVDGTVLAPLGTSGAVIRDLSLDPSSLQARFGGPPVR